MRKRKERREKSKTQRLNSNKHVEESILPTNEDRQEEAEAEPQAEEEVEAKKGFFACYLLCSLNPRFKGQTYIGFTVNPRRRIRQHNGEISSGAWRTKSKRPWEMILCIYGFPTNVSALQFEWAWQHPIESLAVRKAAAEFKSLSGIANKIKLAYTMLTLPPWQSLKLTVNFFSTKYMKHGAGCPSLPKQIKVQFSLMDELLCYTNFGQSLDEDDELNGDASPLHSTSVYQGQMTWDETNTARHTEDTLSLNGSTSVYEDQMTWDETDTTRHTEDTLSLNGEDHTSPFHTASTCRDETDTVTQMHDKFSLNGDDTRLPLDLVDSPLRTPSSSSTCFGNRIGSVAEDPQGLIQDNCHDLGQENKKPTKRHLSSSELGFVQPNHKSRREAGKRQVLIVDSPEEAAFSSVFDMGNSVEKVHNRDFLGSIEENSNKVGESPMHQLESSSFATKDQLPSTNNLRSFPEVDVIDILTPSSNSITYYFRKKKRSSSVCNNNDIIDLTRSPSFIQL